MAVVSEKSWFGPCYSNSHVFKNAKKCCFFLVLTALLVRWDLAFAGSFCRLPLCGSATAFACFWNNKFQEFFKNSYYSRPHLLAQKRAILPNFWCFWRTTFRQMEQFVLDRSLVLFVVDNFRLHRFFRQKTPRKSWTFDVFFLPMWIPPKRKSKFHFGVKKNPTLIAVRIGVSCFYTFFTVFEHLVFYMCMFHWCVVPIRVSWFYTTFTFSKCRKSYIFCGSWKWFSALLVLCYVIGIY